MKRVPGLRRGWFAVLLALVLALSACTGGSEGGEQRNVPPGAPELAAKLAAALAAGEVTGLPLTGDAARAELDHKQVTVGMAGLWPEVDVGEITYSDDGHVATANLEQRYPFKQGDWTFTSTATLYHADDGWKLAWSPAIVHPELEPTTRLYRERLTAPRAPIIDANGVPIVEDRPVYRVGIDKTHISEDQFEDSARQLAAAVGVDADPFVQEVLNAGPQAFVVAITLRDGQVPADIELIPGVRAMGTSLPLAPTASFARGILGVSGEATAEVIEASDGAILMGDIVGLSGIQRIHDEQLRGVAGQTITIIKRTDNQLAELPPPTPSTEPGVLPSSPSTPKPPNQVLFQVAPTPGTPLQLTMEIALQQRAEDLLAAQPSLVMVAVLDTSTGGLLAAANSPVAGAQSFVTTGRYPPGSTMKVATALALIRAGYTPESPVNCSATAEVHGKVFTNYPGYPAAHVGQIPLQTALRESCNTAFINASRDLDPQALSQAAASLGMGVDYETGFDAFYGSVEPSDDPVVRAANTIGQGNVLASPMSMAAEAASVAAGRTVIPHLIAGQAPTPDAAPLTEQEAAMLRQMMTAVVADGTLMPLRGVLNGGKSGTAEYTNDVPPKTHSWTVGYVGRYAIAVMDYEGRGSVSMDVLRAMLA